jgi:lipopolysaccharide/colanic/teichoic acid biosynthesis glycosyltransferase
LGGRSIDVLKFRTMTDDRDAFGQLLDDEHRTPKVGCFLRRTRLDELPSLLAVIKGDMSLVGPRPLPESSYPDGTTQIWRLSLPPGLTGLAQVSGNTLLTPLEKFAIDRHYIRTRSTGLDLLILARTLVTVVAGEKRDDALIGHLVKGPEIGNG